MQRKRRLMKLFVLLVIASCLAAACVRAGETQPAEVTQPVIETQPVTETQPAPESWPTQGWQSTAPEAQGMDSAVLVQLFEEIEKSGIRLHSLLIVRNGYLVTEAYWDPYGPDDQHSIESNTKSIVGSLAGIAMEQGLLTGVEQKMVDFFPERTIQNLDEQKKAISLQNLLSMTPGLDCQDQSSAGQGMNQADDWTGYLLDLPVIDPPGTRWIYCSGAAHLISAILQDAAGMDARSYANTHLFKPLGIPEVPQADWNTTPEGVSNGVAGLYLRPRDLAKFGYLYLKKGNWDGQQVVPAEWVEESTREQAYIGPDDYVGGLDRRFGYMWSIFPDLKYYGYLGMAGQELYVLPDTNTVVVFNGSLEVGKEAALLRLVNDTIAPAAVTDEALPPNPQAAAKLESLIQLAKGTTQLVPALPQAALDISGKTYLLDANPLGWKDMTFIFQPEADTAVLKMSGSPDLTIGLDNRYRLTETPGSRPVGLRGRWLTPGEFELDYIIHGDFIESTAQIEFTGDRIKLAIKNLNFPGPALVLQGEAEE